MTPRRDVIRVRSRSRPVPYDDPFAAYQRLAARYGERSVFLLESLAGPESVARRSAIGIGPLAGLRLRGRHLTWHGHPPLLRRLRRTVAATGLLTDRPSGAEPYGDLPSANGADELAGEDRVWDLLRHVRDRFEVTRDAAEPRFRFGFFGYLGYDMAWAVERLPHHIPHGGGPAGHMPDLDLTIYAAYAEYDVTNRTARLVTNHGEPWPSPDEDALLAALRPGDDPPGPGEVPGPEEVADSVRPDHYARMVDTALGHIGRGDIYQVQLGHELTIRTPLAPLDAYRRLRTRNPSPYGYLARLGPYTVLGASPELFVRSEGGAVTMKPIAGTAPRVGVAARDEATAERLRADEKEIAEHVMLVDLCRNDVGRICRPGSLRASGLLEVEPYSHVQHLVSTVTGRLAPGRDEYDVIAAAFPAGTMTGAPKVRAMEIIEALETTRRGVYAGAIGLIDFGGDLNTALCIRSAVHHGNAYVIRASAGVVADSDPDREWDETLHKLGALHWALTGQEVVDRAGAAR